MCARFAWWRTRSTSSPLGARDREERATETAATVRHEREEGDEKGERESARGTHTHTDHREREKQGQKEKPADTILA